MFLKRYESTEVDRRTWLHVPSGLSGPPNKNLFHPEKTQKEIAWTIFFVRLAI